MVDAELMVCFGVCLGHPHRQAGEGKVGTLCLCKNPAEPNFSVLTCVAKELSALKLDCGPLEVVSLGRVGNSSNVGLIVFPCSCHLP